MTKKYYKDKDENVGSEIYSQRINDLKFEKQLTLDDLKEKTDIPKPTISAWIKGKYIPNIKGISEIAKALDVSVDYLLGNTDVKPLNLELQAISKLTGLSEKSINKLSTFNAENDKSWGMDLINLFIESDNFDILIFYLLQYATKKNHQIDYSYYNVNTKDIAFTKIQDTISVISKELCSTFEKNIEKTGDTRTYYLLLEHLYNTNKITSTERSIILDEFKKGNYACLQDDNFENELKQRAKNKEVNI